jgi:hypothetical protein
MKKPFEGLEIGDVILLTDGRLARVASEIKKYHSGADYFMLQFMDKSGEHFQEDDGTIDIERNLGQSEDTLASFYTARSIHMRLNDAKGLFGEA